MHGLEPRPAGLPRAVTGPLLRAVDALAGLLLAADVAVILVSVFDRYVRNAPDEWSDDVARMLMVALGFFGAAAALARSENVGIVFFVQRLPPGARRAVDAAAAAAVAATAAAVAVTALQMALLTSGQTSGSGLPGSLAFYPMAAAGGCMAVFALDRLLALGGRSAALGAGVVLAAAALWWGFTALAPDADLPAPWLMLLAFLAGLFGGMPIGFVLAFSALVFIWMDGSLPASIFAQQMARGIDNFVLLAIPFFILIGYLMEANGMSVRLIAALERLVGRMRGGLNVVMVLSMVVFSGISGSKMADVAAVGSVLIPAARRSGQDPGNAVALLAASAVMAETIPPCINLIILGFVANLSIGGLFLAGLLPAGLMALVLVAAAVAFGSPAPIAPDARLLRPMRELWGGIAVAAGLILIIFGGFKSGVATAT